MSRSKIETKNSNSLENYLKRCNEVIGVINNQTETAEDGGFEPIRDIPRKIGLLVPLKYPSPRETAPKMESPRLGPFPGRRGLFQSRLFSCFIFVMRSCRS